MFHICIYVQHNHIDVNAVNYLQCQKKYGNVLNDNIRLKKDQSDLLAGINIQEQKYKELEEKYNRAQRDVEIRMKEKEERSRYKYEQYKVELDKDIKLLNQDTDVSS